MTASTNLIHSSKELVIRLDTQSLLAVKNLCEQILQELINKNIQELASANKKSVELQKEMNDLYFFLDEVITFIEKKQQQILKEFVLNEELEKHTLIEQQMIASQLRSEEIVRDYDEYLQAEMARIQQLEYQIQELIKDLQDTKRILEHQKTFHEKNIQVLQESIQRLSSRVEAQFRNASSQILTNYRIEELVVNNRKLVVTSDDLREAFDNEFKNGFGNLKSDEIESKVERAFRTALLAKLTKSGIAITPEVLAKGEEWVQKSKATWMNTFNARADVKDIYESLDKIQAFQINLADEVRKLVSVNQKSVILEAAIAEANNLQDHLVNPNRSVSIDDVARRIDNTLNLAIELKTDALSNQMEVKNAEASDLIKGDQQEDNLNSQGDDMFSMDDFDDDEPSPPYQENNPDNNDYGQPPPGDPPAEGPGPNGEPPPNYPSDENDAGIGSQPVPSAPNLDQMIHPEPSAPPQEFEDNVAQNIVAQHVTDVAPAPNPPPSQSSMAGILRGLNISPSAVRQTDEKKPLPLPAMEEKKRDSAADAKSANVSSQNHEDESIQPRRPGMK